MRKTPYALSIAMLALAAVTYAADPPKNAPSAHEKAEMEAMMKAATPGEAHQKLSPMVGTFDVKIKMWSAPSAPPVESTGKSVSTWVLGNRWVAENFEGTFMGMPFSGIGYTGYDNIQKIYVGTWMESMSTQMMVSKGSADAGGKTMNFTSSMADPMSGKTMPVKEKVTVTDENHHMMEMWSPGPKGKMFKMMEITYTRSGS